MQHYARLAYPLTELLKHNQFQWSESAQEAFEELKKRMTNTPVLVLPNFLKMFVVETDASGLGVGAVLSQEGHPIAFFSKKLSSRLALASAYVRELYAITQAIMKWRHYLLGRRFLIKTDHRSLKELMYQVVQTPEQQFYLAKLMGFQYDIVYRTGKSNVAADALSRVEELSGDGEQSQDQFFAITAAQHTIMELLQQANQTHAVCQSLHDQFKQGTLPAPYSVRADLLLYDGKLFVPGDDELQAAIMEYYHSSVIGGHGGVAKTLAGISEIFYWPGMRAAVSEYVHACVVCQQTKYATTKPFGLL